MIQRIVFWTTSLFTTKIHLRVNGAGLPILPDITPGQTSEYLGFDLVTDHNLTEPSVLLADRGYAYAKVSKAMARAMSCG